MGFIIGEVDSREQNPWAYDADNDLLKTDSGLYLAVAGLATSRSFDFGNIAASGNDTSVISYWTIPAGKVGYVTTFSASSTGGPVLAEIYATQGGANSGVASVMIGPNGGCSAIDLRVPFAIQPGTVGFAVNNLDGAAAHRISVVMSVAIL